MLTEPDCQRSRRKNGFWPWKLQLQIANRWRSSIALFKSQCSIAWEIAKVSRKGVLALLTPKILQLQMAQVLQKPVFTLAGCQQMTANTRLCDILVCQNYPFLGSAMGIAIANRKNRCDSLSSFSDRPSKDSFQVSCNACSDSLAKYFRAYF